MTIYVPGKLVLDSGNVPAAIAGVSPTLDYRFAREKREIETVSLTDKLTYTGGNGTFVGSDGFIQRATTNMPRFDHDPTTNKSLGLLVEENRTNYLFSYASPSYNNGAAVYSAYSDSRFGAPHNAHSWTYANATTSVELGWFNPGSINTTGNGIQYSLGFWAKANQAYQLRGNLVDERRSSVSFNFNLTTEWQYFTTATPAGVNDDGAGNVYFRWLRGGGIQAIPAGLRIDFACVNLERGGFSTSYIPASVSAATRTESAVINGAGIITGTYTVVEKPAGCAAVNGGNIELQAGYRTERVMVFPVVLSAQQITDIRSVM